MQPLRNSLLALALLYSAPALAERADRDQPVYLEADQVMIDDARQISTYTGRVRLTQGTLLVLGDKLVVTEDPQGHTVNTVYGRTAEFRQKREGLDEYVQGYGQRIVYDTRAENIDLFGQARIIQGLDDLRGEHITYSAKTEIYLVDSGQPAKPGQPKSRVSAVLHPKTKPDTPPATTAGQPGKKPSPTE